MTTRASLSPQEERRFLSAWAAALPVIMLTLAGAAIPPGHWGFFRPAFGLFITLKVCAGPFMLVPVPWLAPIVGMVAIFVWLWRVRSGSIGDWGWKVHLAISALY